MSLHRVTFLLKPLRADLLGAGLAILLQDIRAHLALLIPTLGLGSGVTNLNGDRVTDLGRVIIGLNLNTPEVKG